MPVSTNNMPAKTSTRDFVRLYLNGRLIDVRGGDVYFSLSDFLRRRRDMVGTKIVCSEGDCGACSVLVGRLNGDEYEYQVVDACIQFLFQLDGCHVVTVEGLKTNGRLHPVQQAMVDCHGSQCGFCTPGFVVSMAGLLEHRERLDERQWRTGLTGNLCRCTGYTPILQAGFEAQQVDFERIAVMYPAHAMREGMLQAADPAIQVDVDEFDDRRVFYSPTDLSQATDFLQQYPDAVVVAGATDIGVAINKGTLSPRVILDLNRIRELEQLTVKDGTIVAGARATWSQLEQLTESLVPEFHKILRLFGAPQIRNVGTIGGNIVNASPIADSVPFLFVTEAELELQSAAGTRTVNINDFYHGYKQTELKPGELLTNVRIPLPDDGAHLRLYKVSKRRDLDIAGFTAAILMRLDGDEISSAAVAFGAVGAMVIRARQTEAFLIGRPFNEQTLRAAGDVAVGEISPISDVRGSQDFRLQLARNVLLKFLYEVNVSATGAVLRN